PLAASRHIDLFDACSPPQFCSVNEVEGEPKDRQMTTARNHTVRDIYCCKCKCGTTLGWKYGNMYATS
ncbi:hypothetical protein V8D89_008003, partial [Ganoderma adspersum]